MSTEKYLKLKLQKGMGTIPSVTTLDQNQNE